MSCIAISTRPVFKKNMEKNIKMNDTNTINNNSCTNISNNNNNNTNNNSNNNSKDNKTKDFEDFEYRGYHKFGRILGQGSFGTVVECVRKSDSKSAAIKLVERKAVHKWVPVNKILADLDCDQETKNELLNLQEKILENCQPYNDDYLVPIEVASLIRSNKLNGVVKIMDYWPTTSEKNNNTRPTSSENETTTTTPTKTNEDSTMIGIVLERNYSETCLFDYVMEKQRINEIEARIILRQIIEINTNLLTKIGILHGDLKLENMLIDKRSKRIKLIDFGSAELFDLTNNSANSIGRSMKSFRGTDLYKPPEYLLHHCYYPRTSTVWTYGIILYNLVCGDFPFKDEKDILAYKDNELKFNNNCKNDLSNNVKDLLKRCLAFYAADRIVMAKILQHPWLNPQQN